MIANRKKLVPAILYPNSDNYISICVFDNNVLVKKKPQYRNYLDAETSSMERHHSQIAFENAAVTAKKYLTVAYFGRKYFPVNYTSTVESYKFNGETKYSYCTGIDYKPKYIRLTQMTTKNVCIEEKTIIYRTTIYIDHYRSYDENGNIEVLTEDGL